MPDSAAIDFGRDAQRLRLDFRRAGPASLALIDEGRDFRIGAAGLLILGRGHASSPQ